MKYNIFDVIKAKDERIGTIVEVLNEDKSYNVILSKNANNQTEKINIPEKDITEIIYKR